MPELELAVPPETAGERLDRFLAGIPEIGSRSAAERLLREGCVTVGGRVRPKSHRLAGGETIAVALPEAAPHGVEPEVMDLRVPYRDRYLVIVDKPAGLVVHPSAGHATGTLVHGLLGLGAAGGTELERPGIVHRLDRDTSGLLVVALDSETHRHLQRLLRRREITREYLALVRGRPRSWRGRIEAPIGRDRTDPRRVSLDTNRPRHAVTHFEVIELLPEHALLRVRLDTGRTHQIRVHLEAIGLPVSGDPIYGRAGDLGLGRQFLHAARLVFVHPRTGDPVDVESELPAELAAALARARG